MKEFYYRLGAYYGILTALTFNNPDENMIIESEDETDWVPVDEHNDTQDEKDSWLL